MSAHHALGFVTCLMFISAAVGPFAAAPPKAKASISISVAGLGCSTGGGADTFDARSWSWGATNEVALGGGGGGGGKAVASDLSLQRLADACSPALLGAVLTGRHYQRLTLTQLDGDGVATASVLLEDVVLSSWNIGGSSAAAEAVESVSVKFAKITFTDLASGNAICYNLATQTKC